jgi:quercetin dioxygenase-like cupin family protein
MAYRQKLIVNPSSGQSIRFLQTSKDTGGAWLEMESFFQPHSKEPVAHYHPKQREDFTVLEGTLKVRINGMVQQLQAGNHLHVAPNTVHSMWNAGEVPARVAWRVTPALETEYFLENGMGLANDGKMAKNGMPTLLQTVLTARRFSHVFRITKPPYPLQRLLFAVLAPIAYLKGYRGVYKKYLD